MHSIKNKIISVFLCIIMIVLSCQGLVAFAADEANTTTAEGTFVCDWFDESITYPYEYSDEWFSGSSTEYNHSLATLSLEMAMASFNSFDEENREGHIEEMLKQCGFETVSYGYDTEGYDTIGLEIGQKDMTFDGKTYTTLALIIRSGNYGMEWGGNFRIGKGVDHKGFDMAKQLVFQYLNDYLGTNKIENDVKVLVAGYSRGGSVSNLVTADLDDGDYTTSLLAGTTDNIGQIKLTKDNLYTYTFEAPQCTRNETAHNDVYSNIFNMINPNDYVPKFVMDEWGFTHYGIEYYYPSADNCSNYDDYYEKLCDEFDYVMADSGKKSVDFFYDSEHSKSLGATLDYVLGEIATDVAPSQEYYADTYEGGAVVVGGQYLSQKMGVGDASKTLGVAIFATLVSLIPSNLQKIKSDGYRTYLAQQIANSDAGASMTDEEIDGLLELLTKFLDFANNNTYNIFAFTTQLKTFIYVHQPYISLAWMRSMTKDDIMAINDNKGELLTLNCMSLTLKHNTNARIEASYNEDGGYVKWETYNARVASVDDNGNVRAGVKGTTVITATLYSADGKPIAKDSVKVTTQMNIIQVVINSVRNAVSR